MSQQPRSGHYSRGYIQNHIMRVQLPATDFRDQRTGCWDISTTFPAEVKDKYTIFFPVPESISRKYELQSSFTFSKTRLSKNRIVLQTGCGSLTYGRKRSGRMTDKEMKIILTTGPIEKKRQRHKDKNILKVLEESNRQR